MLHNLYSRYINVPGNRHSGGIIICCNFFLKKIMILQKACETFATKIKDNVRNKNNLKSQMSFLPLILLIITASVEYPL